MDDDDGDVYDNNAGVGRGHFLATRREDKRFLSQIAKEREFVMTKSDDLLLAPITFQLDQLLGDVYKNSTFRNKLKYSPKKYPPEESEEKLENSEIKDTDKNVKVNREFRLAGNAFDLTDPNKQFENDSKDPEFEFINFDKKIEVISSEKQFVIENEIKHNIKKFENINVNIAEETLDNLQKLLCETFQNSSKFDYIVAIENAFSGRALEINIPKLPIRILSEEILVETADSRSDSQISLINSEVFSNLKENSNYLRPDSQNSSLNSELSSNMKDILTLESSKNDRDIISSSFNAENLEESSDLCRSLSLDKHSGISNLQNKSLSSNLTMDSEVYDVNHEYSLNLSENADKLSLEKHLEINSENTVISNLEQLEADSKDIVKSSLNENLNLLNTHNLGSDNKHLKILNQEHCHNSDKVTDSDWCEAETELNNQSYNNNYKFKSFSGFIPKVFNRSTAENWGYQPEKPTGVPNNDSKYEYFDESKIYSDSSERDSNACRESDSALKIVYGPDTSSDTDSDPEKHLKALEVFSNLDDVYLELEPEGDSDLGEVGSFSDKLGKEHLEASFKKDSDKNFQNSTSPKKVYGGQYLNSKLKRHKEPKEQNRNYNSNFSSYENIERNYPSMPPSNPKFSNLPNTASFYSRHSANNVALNSLFNLPFSEKNHRMQRPPHNSKNEKKTPKRYAQSGLLTGFTAPDEKLKNLDPKLLNRPENRTNSELERGTTSRLNSRTNLRPEHNRREGFNQSNSPSKRLEYNKPSIPGYNPARNYSNTSAASPSRPTNRLAKSYGRSSTLFAPSIPQNRTSNPLSEPAFMSLNSPIKLPNKPSRPKLRSSSPKFSRDLSVSSEEDGDELRSWNPSCEEEETYRYWDKEEFPLL